MFVNALPAGTRANLALLADAGLADPFYLAGGTADYTTNAPLENAMKRGRGARQRRDGPIT